MIKTKNIIIRVNIFDYKLIKIKAQDSGLSTSEYIRRCALNKTIPKDLNQEELVIYKDLKKFHHNFTSITNLLKKGDYNEMINQIVIVQQLIKDHLNQITHGK